ncbi:MAG: hypothetical protein CVV51_00995 [Spirochaetae bacterium HGW-Spirochaetae-7]|jgi:hypothetical protein|nr:MAG: hypothetical protein CVV51_00995 [Spirochaetae bacterium HGW-Spirochaetae-7]
MKKVIVAALAMMTLGSIAVFAQSGAEIDKLLSTDEVSQALASRFVLPAADILPANATPEASFAAAREKGWLPADAEPDAPIRLSTLSFLIAQSFGMKGGMMYSIAPGPRYAYRELVYLRIIQGVSDPALTVSGERLMRILGRMLDRQGGES